MSRVVVGAHWPTDVLGGMACGVFSGWLGYRLAAGVDWFCRPAVLAGARLFLMLCALVLLASFDSGYPLARLFEQAIALSALGATLLLWAGRVLRKARFPERG